jgi:hypothetical protein
MHLTKAILISAAALSIAALACSRYEYVPPDPAACHPPPSSPPRSLTVFGAEWSGIHGRVLSSSTRLAGARIRAAGLVAISDSEGQFALPALPPGKTAIATDRTGFDARRDTIIVPDSGGLDLTIRLDAVWSPGVACANALMTPQPRRKPWWKWW